MVQKPGVSEKGIFKPSGSEPDSCGNSGGLLLLSDKKPSDSAGTGGFKGNTGTDRASDGCVAGKLSACDGKSGMGCQYRKSFRSALPEQPGNVPRLSGCH